MVQYLQGANVVLDMLRHICCSSWESFYKFTSSLEMSFKISFEQQEAWQFSDDWDAVPCSNS